MTTATARQPDAWYSALKRLHAVAGKAGYGHEELHDQAVATLGVSSLRELSPERLHAWADEMEGRPERRRPSQPSGAARPAQPTLGMSKAQRELAFCLWRDAGYTAEDLDAWLRRQGYEWSLWQAYIDPAEGRGAIDKLLNLLAERAAHFGWTFRRTRDGYELSKPRTTEHAHA